jgi:hypothetical protein
LSQLGRREYNITEGHQIASVDDASVRRDRFVEIGSVLKRLNMVTAIVVVGAAVVLPLGLVLPRC